MSLVQLLAALALGSFLAATPFLRYAHLGASLIPHADHAARHGGRLVMLGDHHVELVRGCAGIQVFVSDAVRRPLQPVSASARFDGGPRVALHWEDHRMLADGDARSAEVELEIALEGGVRLAGRFAP